MSQVAKSAVIAFASPSSTYPATAGVVAGVVSSVGMEGLCQPMESAVEPCIASPYEETVEQKVDVGNITGGSSSRDGVSFVRNEDPLVSLLSSRKAGFSNCSKGTEDSNISYLIFNFKGVSERI